MYQWLAEQYNTSVLYSGRLDDMASSRGSGPLIRLLSDGCRWKVDEGLGPATLQVVTRVKPKACAGMQGSRVKLQGTGTVTGHMASNIIHAYSIMPGHMHAILNYRQHTHKHAHSRRPLSQTAGGFQSESQSMGNKEERDSSPFLRLLLYLFVPGKSHA